MQSWPSCRMLRGLIRVLTAAELCRQEWRRTKCSRFSYDGCVVSRMDHDILQSLVVNSFRLLLQTSRFSGCQESQPAPGTSLISTSAHQVCEVCRSTWRLNVTLIVFKLVCRYYPHSRDGVQEGPTSVSIPSSCGVKKSSMTA